MSIQNVGVVTKKHTERENKDTKWLHFVILVIIIRF